MVLRSLRKHQILVLVCKRALIYSVFNFNLLACVGMISNCGSRAELSSGQASLNRSITLDSLAPLAGVNVSSYVHRERTGVFGTAIPSRAGEFATNLVAAANAREVTDGARAHALAQLHAASSDRSVVTEDYLHMAAYQVGYRNFEYIINVRYRTLPLALLHLAPLLELRKAMRLI